MGALLVTKYWVMGAAGLAAAVVVAAVACGQEPGAETPTSNDGQASALPAPAGISPAQSPGAAAPATPSKPRPEDMTSMRGDDISGDEHQQAFTLALEDLQQRLGADISSIQLSEVESVEWSDTSLGSPEPGMMYAQVIVPGFRMVLEVGARTYVYHTSMDRVVFVEGLQTDTSGASTAYTETSETPSDVASSAVVPAETEGYNTKKPAPFNISPSGTAIFQVPEKGMESKIPSIVMDIIGKLREGVPLGPVGLVQVNSENKLLLEFHAGTAVGPSEASDIEALGADIEMTTAGISALPGLGIIVAWIPHDRVEVAAELAWVVAVRPVEQNPPDVVVP